MSSPLKYETYAETEEFSPVKLPGKLTPLAKNKAQEKEAEKSEMTKERTKTASGSNRRNTIHHHSVGRRKLIETPLVDTHNGKEAFVGKQMALTSPRFNNIKHISMENLRKYKTKIDVKLSEMKTNKENANPFQSSPKLDAMTTPARDENESAHTISSPIKRRHDSMGYDEGSKKIAKVMTNAEEQSNPSDEAHDHSVQIDEIFNKEDIVGRISAGRSSPQVNNKGSQIIDNDSESDADEYARSEGSISQTVFPSLGVDNTQLSKIIRSNNDSKDYVTPQRYTEPVARSPDTHQHVRMKEELMLDANDNKNISDSKDITSPIKAHRLAQNIDINSDDEFPNKDIENEPTINFLMSPNSKPVFSVDQINKIQDKQTQEIRELQSAISDKNQELYKANQKISSIANDLLISESKIEELKQEKHRLVTSEEVLAIQLKHNERDLATLTKNFKIKQSLADHLELKLTKNKSKIQELIKQINDKMETHNQEIENHNLTIKSLESTIKNKDEKLSDLMQQNLDYNLKISTILTEKEEILGQVQSLTQDKNELSKKLDEERDLNLRQEELVKELDKLENLAKDKILSLEDTLGSKNSEIDAINDELASVQQELRANKDSMEVSESEKNQLMEACDKLEKKNASLHQELDNVSSRVNSINRETEEEKEERRLLEDKNAELRRALDESNISISGLVSRVEELKAENDVLKAKVKKIESNNTSLTESNSEKDKTIREDTKRMNELVNAIEHQKATYEEKLTKLLSERQNSSTLESENEYLKKQLKSQEGLLEKKIQEVATFLHHEYAEKHMRKLRDVKDKYEKDLNVSALEKKTFQREIDSLKRKLSRANEECQRVNEFVHLNKLNYSSTASSGLSPKRSNGAKSRYL